MREEFLAFELGDELYAVPIGKVREIVGGAPRLTPIPNAPAFLKGLISLRGDVLPLVDLRKEFGLPTPPYDKFTVVILAEVVGVIVGVVVDRVVDVLAFGPGEIHAPPGAPRGAGADRVHPGPRAVERSARRGARARRHPHARRDRHPPRRGAG